MALKHYKVRAEIVRKTTDPFFNPKKHGSQTITYYNCFFDINNLIPRMMDAPIDNANPRDHENLPNNSVIRDIREEYLNDGSMFHLKNSGITMNVQYVDEVGDGILNIAFDDDKEKRHGILNGGTTFTVLKDLIKELQEENYDLPRNKYVKVELRVGLDPQMVPSTSEGLNTHASVTRASLLTLENKFDFIKDALKEESYDHQISYRQYEDGELDVTRLLQYMTVFNVNYYTRDGDKHPVRAYSSKANCVKSFTNREPDYHAMAGILPNILETVDEIRLQAYNCLANKRSSKYVKVARNKNEFRLLTSKSIDDKISHDIADAILFPILGAFRSCLISQGGVISWRENYAKIIDSFREVAPKMFNKIDKIYKEVGDVNQVGKLSSTWEAMYDILDKQMTKQLRKVA